MATFNEEYESLDCANCGLIFYVNTKYKNRLRESHDTFYCPAGHSQWFPGKRDEDVLREQLIDKNKTINNLVLEIKELKKPKPHCKYCNKDTVNNRTTCDACRKEQAKKRYHKKQV